MEEFDVQLDNSHVLCKTNGVDITDLEVWVDLIGVQCEIGSSLSDVMRYTIAEKVLDEFNSREPDVMIGLKEDPL